MLIDEAKPYTVTENFAFCVSGFLRGFMFRGSGFFFFPLLSLTSQLEPLNPEPLNVYQKNERSHNKT